MQNLKMRAAKKGAIDDRGDYSDGEENNGHVTDTSTIHQSLPSEQIPEQ